MAACKATIEHKASDMAATLLKSTSAHTYNALLRARTTGESWSTGEQGKTG